MVLKILNCQDKSIGETFCKSREGPMIWRRQWHAGRQTEVVIFQYINGFYNFCRRHSYLGGISPLTL